MWQPNLATNDVNQYTLDRMSTDLVPTMRGISLPMFFGGLLGGWVAITVLAAFPLNWALKALVAVGSRFYVFLVCVVVLSFGLFYWLAGARWPSGSRVSRFGFTVGLAAVNYVAVLFSVVTLKALIYGL